MKYRAYIDIEKTGLSSYYSELTFIGIALVKGRKCQVVQLLEDDIYEAKLLKVLKGVGEIDTNVDPASTMQVVDALIKADKTFDLLVIPGSGHGMGGDYGERKLYDFFVHHLLGIEPPHWNAIETEKEKTL